MKFLQPLAGSAIGLLAVGMFDQPMTPPTSLPRPHWVNIATVQYGLLDLPIVDATNDNMPQ
jgi:hypothetical protein